MSAFLLYTRCQKFCPIRGCLMPSFRRKPESRGISLVPGFRRDDAWTPVPAPDPDPGFAGVTADKQALTFGKHYKIPVPKSGYPPITTFFLSNLPYNCALKISPNSVLWSEPKLGHCPPVNSQAFSGMSQFSGFTGIDLVYNTSCFAAFCYRQQT